MPDKDSLKKWIQQTVGAPISPESIFVPISSPGENEDFRFDNGSSYCACIEYNGYYAHCGNTAWSLSLYSYRSYDVLKNGLTG